jgi:hypothetical protein
VHIRPLAPARKLSHALIEQLARSLERYRKLAAEQKSTA